VRTASEKEWMAALGESAAENSRIAGRFNSPALIQDAENTEGQTRRNGEEEEWRKWGAGLEFKADSAPETIRHLLALSVNTLS